MMVSFCTRNLYVLLQIVSLLLVTLSLSSLTLAFTPSSIVTQGSTTSSCLYSTTNNNNNESTMTGGTSVATTIMDTATSSVQTDGDHNTSNNDIDDEENDEAFKLYTKQLCNERNIPFQKVKNARDLASVANSPVLPNRIYRMGRIGDATETDLDVLFNTIQIKTLVDLRSPTELKDDASLMRPEVFQNFTNIIWQERKSINSKKDCLRILDSDESPVQYKNPDLVKKSIQFWNRNNKKNTSPIPATTTSSTVPDNVNENDVMILATYDNLDEDDNVVLPMTNSNNNSDNDGEDDELCGIECMDEEQINTSTMQSNSQQKERYFVSLMNEFKYVKGTVSKVRKRDITAAILKSPGAMFSKRIRSNVKEPFLNKINDGGLFMLNELLIQYGAPGIRYVLQLCSDRTKHPIAFYCTAGKDRTGAIAAIILSLCGTKIEDIIEDYSLSANVYAEMNDHQAMVGALSQRNLDPKTFLCAPPNVMRQTIQFIINEYGSVENYCTTIGFTKEQQEQLRRACMDP